MEADALVPFQIEVTSLQADVRCIHVKNTL